jgi:hypothetical protein
VRAGRPPRGAEAARGRSIRFTAEEAAEVERAALRSGLAFGQFVRRAALAAVRGPGGPVDPEETPAGPPERVVELDPVG